MDTGQIINLMRNRDQSGLKYLIEAYSNALMGTITRILNNKETSEEVLQESFLKIWQSFDQYDEDKATLFTWMSRIARNTALDKRRMKNYAYITQVENLEGDTIASPNNDSQIIASIDINELTKGLPSKYKEVLDLVYIQGYTHIETADRLGIPSGTVKTRLSKAMVLLREIIEDEKYLILGALTIIIIILMTIWN